MFITYHLAPMIKSNKHSMYKNTEKTAFSMTVNLSVLRNDSLC